MNTSNATGIIRVRKIPLGSAPEWIRAAWIGLTLPCYPVSGMMPGPELDLFTGRQLCGERKVVVVPQAEAIAALEKERPQAAQWWKDRGFPRDRPFPMPSFYFGEDEVEIFDGVEKRALIDGFDLLGIPA